ncbi:MAG: penicillin acylase family protein [Fimbriimonas sp.]
MLLLGLGLISGFLTPLDLPEIKRDSYGVPQIRAASAAEAYRGLGYAVAQDRMWQMETSRRTATGRMAEVFGPSYVASDRETLLTGYTQAELEAQFAQLSPETQTAFRAYAEGVNLFLESGAPLPDGYAKHGFRPKAWTVWDSVSVTILLFRRFGTGGAGELRNMALLAYFATQPKLKGQEAALLDDFIWQNDAKAIPTLAPEDDPQRKNPPSFASYTAKQTADHLANLPKLGLLELLPAVRLASAEDTRLVAEHVAAPFKTGSYCVVVGGKRSATGEPLLLSGPQMGFTLPSVIHEAAIVTPQIRVVGMDVPGIPSIAIGHTPELAWGLTTGAADTEDIVSYAKEATGYRYGDKVIPFERRTEEIPVKGAATQTVEVLRTKDGPLVLNGRTTVFARRSVYWKSEILSTDVLAVLLRAKNPKDVAEATRLATVNFNLFYATRSGDIGWRYTGKFPIRASSYDPRLPFPGGPATEWKGFLPFDQIPNVVNPKSGIIANWNNKPAAWWPNLDTPTWQRVFRNQALLDNLTKPLLSAPDLETAAWDIARRKFEGGYNYTAPALMPSFRRALSGEKSPEAKLLLSFDGRAFDGQLAPTVFDETTKALREELFTAKVGSFINPDFFQTAIQPGLVLAALEGRTKIDFRAGRTPDAIIQAAFAKAKDRLQARKDWAYRPGTIPSPDGVPIPYNQRGTYIQLIELGPVLHGRNVVTPGVAETGPHSADQAPLARAWTFKPMWELR